MMDNSASSSPTISKKTGALVFFVGCAIGLVISEILVGVASQKASQEAHKASVEYIQQVRKGGNGSVDKRHPSLQSPTNTKTPPGPGVKHLATLQSTVLVSRADNIRRSAEELEWEKKHKIEETHSRPKKVKKEKEKGKIKPHPRRNIHKGPHKKHPQTVNVIRIRAAGDGRIVTRICHPDDKHCAKQATIQADSKSVDQPIKPYKARRVKRRAFHHGRFHKGHSLDVKPNPVVLKIVSVPTVTTTSPSTKPKPTTKVKKPKKGKMVKIDTSVKKTEIIHTNTTSPAGSGKILTLFKKTTNKTTEKPHKDKKGKSPVKVKLKGITRSSTNSTTIIKHKKPKPKEKSSSKKKTPKTHPFVRKKSSANSTSTNVRPVPKSHPPPKHSKLGTPHKQDNTGTVVQQNTSIWKIFSKGKSNNSTVRKQWFKSPFGTTVAPKNATTKKPKHHLKNSWKSNEEYLQTYSDAQAQHDAPVVQDSSWSSPYGTSSWNEWDAYNPAGGIVESNLGRSSTSGDALDVPPVQLDKKHRDFKNERACKRMMRDMEAFERDEQQKSEELMMVSFRDGVDEVQTLMHSWVKTPVHVMEALTFVSIMACMILYWVEDSIQSRLRKIGFNI